ncbi:MAG: DMT family transporter [Alphaproteobacteria bacterium]|nr:DMT family transporter [Alphaproteobacteria bacterium]
MARTTKYKMGKTEWFLLLTLSVLWGSSFINLKNALSEIEPFTVVFLRITLAALGLLVWSLITKKSFKLPLKQHIILFGMGMTMAAIPFIFFTWGQKYISTSMASIFNGGVPFFTAMFAHFLLGQSERLTVNKIIGLLVGFAGIVTMIGIDAIENFDLTNLGQLSILTATFFYAISGIYNRLFISDDMDNIVLATYSLLWSSLVTGLISFSVEGLPTLNYSGSVWVSLLMISLLSTALAYVLLFKIIKTAGASNTSLTTFIIPIFAITLGTLFLGESFEPNEIIGVILILVGLAFIQNLHKLLLKLIR